MDDEGTVMNGMKRKILEETEMKENAIIECPVPGVSGSQGVQ